MASPEKGAAKKKNGKGGALHTYKSYNFVDKDPVIDLVRTAVQSSKLSYKQIHERSNVSTGTFYSWFHKKTRKPQFATVAATLLALGVREINLNALKRSIKE
jgi:hypothetical protein